MRLMNEEELAAVLREIAQREADEKRDADMARQLQAEQEAALAADRARRIPNAINGPYAGASAGAGVHVAAAVALPEHKADLEELELQRLADQDAEFARILNESINGDGAAAGAGADLGAAASAGAIHFEGKRNAEQAALRARQEADKDTLLARELHASLNGAGPSAGAGASAGRGLGRAIHESKDSAEQDALLAQQLHEEFNLRNHAADTSNDGLLAAELASQLAASHGAGADATASDEALARELASQFDEKQRAERITPETINDAAVARALQKAEGGSHITNALLHQYNNARVKRSMVGGEAWKKIAADLQTILDSNAVVGDPIDPKSPSLTDAHKYTRTLIRDGIPVLFDIDKQFKLSNDTLSPEQVLKEVLAFLETLAVAPERVSGTFARIAKEPALEASETNANAHHLLSRAWTLAKKWGPAYMGAITTCLSDNIGDTGGCIPGLIARLYAPYAQIVGLELGLAPKVQRNRPGAGQ